MTVAEITTSSRREFINVAHMLSHAINILPDDKLVLDVVGGRNIKKSLAVDAFVLAFTHQSGVFHVPASNKMMFESEPSQADGDIARGAVEYNGLNVDIGFTRNLWDQMHFQESAPPPSMLIIPKKNESSLSAVRPPDIRIGLSDQSNGEGAFNHFWAIEFVSDTMRSRHTVQQFVNRCSLIQQRRFKRFRAMTP